MLQTLKLALSNSRWFWAGHPNTVNRTKQDKVVANSMTRKHMFARYTSVQFLDNRVIYVEAGAMQPSLMNVRTI
jgi:hypothetical protein